MSYTPKEPTSVTVTANRDAESLYDLADRQDFADAERGLIARYPDSPRNPDGKPTVDLPSFDWIGDGVVRPDSVNPSLWRQSQVIKKAGLFKVTGGVYQARNADISNLTIVEGETGLVIIDCGESVEASRLGLQMFREHVSEKPVAAVIYTHTHIDHYGGVKGVVDPDDVASGKVPVIGPGTIASFDKYAIGENVVAGNAMSRRAGYAFGSLLPSGPGGFVTCGIGVASSYVPTISYISPTDSIMQTGARRELAGIEFEFLYAPDTEAPEEMHIWIPQFRTLTCAENANHTLHNIQTLRGARTRDARNFARYLDETLQRWGDQAEVHFSTHTWPTWGNQSVVELLESQRDTYKYIHDQALRLANQGYTPLEAAEEIELPEQLGRKWYNRGYHGTLHHDVRAVFTKELGMWDGDPVSLYPHPPAESAKRLVAFAGADKILAEGRRAFDAGDYRWAAEILHQLVFADPDNTEARGLQADAYEQLGYQVEGPQWRYIFLCAARELREGVIPLGFTSASRDTILGMPIDIMFDFAAVHLNGPRAADADLRIDYTFTDHDQTWTMWIKRGVLNARPGAHPGTQLTVAGPKAALAAAILKPAAAAQLAKDGTIILDGDESALETFAGLLDDFDTDFNIVIP